MTRTLHLFITLCALFSTAIAPLANVLPAHADSLAAATQAAAAAPDDQAALPFFPETGFRIANAQFADYFAHRGGLRTFGYPVSRGFKFLGTDVQFFQRQIMQIRPDGGLGTLNILDPELMPYTHINGSVFPATDPAVVGNAPSPDMTDYATKVLDFVKTYSPDVWNGLNVRFGQTFQNTVRYEEAFPTGGPGAGIMPSINLELWGVPTSQPAADPTNASFVYLRFQRGIMHFDAGSGVTQGLLLADYLKAIMTGKTLPADLEQDARTSRFYRQYDPNRPGSLARPLDMPGTDLTGAFEPDSQVVTQPVAVTAPAYDPTRLAYGMGVHLWWQDQGRVTRMVQEAGFGWDKQQIRWADVEKTKGQVDWTEIDRMVYYSLGGGLNLMFSVVTSPTWSRADGRTDGPPDNLQDFSSFMSRLAARYKGQVRAYEVWNEQNLSREWGGGRINAGDYVELLKVVYPAVKAVDPNAIVVSGALTPTGILDPNVAIDDAVYLDQMEQYQGGVFRQVADAVGMHAGGYNNPPEADPVVSAANPTGRFRNHPSFYFRRIEQLHDVLARYGDTRKAWITEFGWSTANQAPGYEYGNDNTPQDQANYLVRAFQWVKTNDPWVASMFVWNLNFATLPDLPPTDEKPPFGILNRDWTPRPAYLALQAMPK